MTTIPEFSNENIPDAIAISASPIPTLINQSPLGGFGDFFIENFSNIDGFATQPTRYAIRATRKRLSREALLLINVNEQSKNKNNWIFESSLDYSLLLEGLNVEVSNLFQKMLKICLRVHLSTKIFEIRQILNNKYNTSDLQSFSELNINECIEVDRLIDISEYISDVSHKLIYKTVKLANGRFVTIPKPGIGDQNISDLNVVTSEISVFFSSFFSRFSMVGSLKYFNKVVYGSAKYKTHITNARIHLSRSSLLTADISKFFPSTRYSKVCSSNLIESMFDSFFLKKFNLSAVRQSPDFDKLLVQKKESIFLIKMFLSTLFINDRLPTGTPYSSSVANFLFNHIDKLINTEIFRHLRNIHKREKSYFNKNRNALIEEFIKNHPDFPSNWSSPDILIENIIAKIYPRHSNNRIRYTRYVDDLSFSAINEKDMFGNYLLSMDFLKKIEKILNLYGYYLNYDKTKIFGKNSAKVVNGISSKPRMTEERFEINSISVNSDKKFNLAMQISGKAYSELTSSEIGSIQYIQSVNRDQAEYVLSKLSDYPACKLLISQKRKERTRRLKAKRHASLQALARNPLSDSIAS
jgi:hypothetical protein